MLRSICACCYAALLDSLRQAPKDLLKLASGEQSDDEDSEGATDDSSPATAVDSVKQQQQTKAASASAAADTADKAVDSSGWPLLKQLRLQLQQHLRRQQHLQLAAVAPQLSKLRNTAIPLPADDLTDVMLPPLPLRAALERYATGATGPAAAAAGAGTGASALLAATGQITVGSTAAPGDADAASTAAAGDTNSSSWLCIAAFDKQVAVLPTKTRPKRLLLMASDGTVHAFLLKGRDDLRVDERLMQFIRASNALLSAEQDMLPAAAVSQSAQALAPASAAAAAVAGWLGSSKQPLRVRPYSITPFGRRAGLVQWVRHTTSLYGLFRSWQQCTAERYQAVAAGKRDAAAAAAAAAASAAAASGEGQQGERTGPAPTSDKAPDASAGASAPVQLLLIVVASKPTDAFYARLLPALQAAGLPVGSARSSWPASKCRYSLSHLMTVWCAFCYFLMGTALAGWHG
jgi:PI-3-kinase-related kinase SMG-1